MPNTIVRIEWDVPAEQDWITADEIEHALRTEWSWEHSPTEYKVTECDNLLAALEAVEWVSDDVTCYCPWCHSIEPDEFDKWGDSVYASWHRGHKSDCPRQLALAKARGE